MSKKLAIIHALSIGKKLGSISRCCLNSFVMRGHEVHLHTYGDIDDIPHGVKQVDANEVIPESKIIKHNQTGSYALFSDIFRYELMRKVDGVYVDCDVYCLQPVIIPEHGYVLGFEDDECINGAILRIPKESDLLNWLLKAAYDPYFVPPWYSSSRQFRLKTKKILGIGRSLADMPWGVIGPKAITYYVKQLDLIKQVEPIDIFYPVHYLCVDQFCDPGLKVSDITSSRTVCIHLYNERLKGIDFDQLDHRSVMYKLLRNEI